MDLPHVLFMVYLYSYSFNRIRIINFLCLFRSRPFPRNANTLYTKCKWKYTRIIYSEKVLLNNNINFYVYFGLEQSFQETLIRCVYANCKYIINRERIEYGKYFILSNETRWEMSGRWRIDGTKRGRSRKKRVEKKRWTGGAYQWCNSATASNERTNAIGECKG